jgi:hypothetical protein
MDYITANAADLGAKSSAAFDVAFSSNPEKKRAMLNLWFRPGIQAEIRQRSNPTARRSR